MIGRERSIIYFIALAFLGCSSDNITISGQSYFPLKVGNYQIYQVNETDILQLTCGTGGQTIKNYQLKTLVTDSVMNPEGDYTYTIHRYTRQDETQSWTDLDTWTARINSNQVVVDEDNISYVKFVFPLINNSTWNGNLYNDLGQELYTLDSLKHTATLSSSSKFQNTFTVVQSNNPDLFVYQDIRLEVYAPSIGLIYKKTRQLSYFTDAACYGQQEVKTGLIYYQSLLSYGRQ